ncbi:hypothetical protein E2C01_090134 [Portunus trituberculatus]|uniref:Uncharacterized protein n=1 Tax=Portunus trituberculatus TaxID=210409 RepID=A0A5B7JFE4_PORTR|nr:hypothetical protein [Portunus trituberculatus]
MDQESMEEEDDLVAPGKKSRQSHWEWGAKIESQSHQMRQQSYKVKVAPEKLGSPPALLRNI